MQEDKTNSSNLIIYTPLRRTHFSFSSLFLNEDINHMVCFSLNDLTQKLRKRFGLNFNFDISFLSQDLLIIKSDEQLFSSKENILYAKISAKKAFGILTNQYSNHQNTKVIKVRDTSHNVSTQNLSLTTTHKQFFPQRIETRIDGVHRRQNIDAFSLLKYKSSFESAQSHDEIIFPNVSKTASTTKYKARKENRRRMFNATTYAFKQNSNNDTVTSNGDFMGKGEDEVFFLDIKENHLGSKTSFKGNTFYTKLNYGIAHKPEVNSSLLMNSTLSFNKKQSNKSTESTKYFQENYVEKKKNILKLKLNIREEEPKNEVNLGEDSNLLQVREENSEIHKSVSVLGEEESIHFKDKKLNEVSKDKDLNQISQKNSSIPERENIYQENRDQMSIVHQKIEEFLINKIDFILKDANTKDLFSVGYFYFKELKDFNIIYLQREFLFYSFLCEKLKTSGEHSKLPFDDNYFSSVQFNEYLQDIGFLIESIIGDYHEFISYIRSKQLKHFLVLDKFFFKNIVLTKSIHLKKSEYINTIIKSLNIDDRISFDDFLEYKLIFANPKVDFRKKCMFIKKVLSIQYLDNSPEKQVEFNRTFGIEERIYLLLKNKDFVEIQSVSREKKTKIDQIFSNFLNYLS